MFVVTRTTSRRREESSSSSSDSDSEWAVDLAPAVSGSGFQFVPSESWTPRRDPSLRTDVAVLTAPSIDHSDILECLFGPSEEPVGQSIGPGRTAVAAHVVVPPFEYLDVFSSNSSGTKTCVNDGATVRADITIIDAAFEDDASLTPELEGYLQRCGAFLFVYDAEDRRSYEAAANNASAVKDIIGENAAVFGFAALPVDEDKQHQQQEQQQPKKRRGRRGGKKKAASHAKVVSEDEGRALASEYRATFFTEFAGCGVLNREEEQEGVSSGASVLSTTLAGVVCLYDAGFHVVCTRINNVGAAECCLCLGAFGCCAAMCA